MQLTERIGNDCLALLGGDCKIQKLFADRWLIARAMILALSLGPFIVSISIAQNSPVIEYHRYSIKLAQRDDTPQLRVYPSGLVEAYFPAWSSRAGRYEMNLPANELGGILSSLRAGGLLMMNSERVRADRDNAERVRRQRGGELYYSSDVTVTRLRIRLDGEPEVELELDNVQPEASRLPQAAILNRVAAFERQLWKLRDDPRMRRFADPNPAPDRQD